MTEQTSTLKGSATTRSAAPGASAELASSDHAGLASLPASKGLAAPKGLAEVFERFLASRSEPDSSIQARRDAFANFAERGLPTTANEDWKYTSVSELARSTWSIARPSPSKGLPVTTREALAQGGLARWGGPVLVFVDGVFQSDLSALESLPKGATIASLGSQLPVVDLPTGHYTGFGALNSAFATDGAYLRLLAGTVVEEPILLLYLANGKASQGELPVAFARNVIVAEPHSQATIVEVYAGAPDAGRYLVDTVTQVQLGEGAVVSHSQLQRHPGEAFHVADVQAEVGRDAIFASGAVSLGAKLARHDLAITLAGEGASCTLDGLYLATGAQHVDFHTAIDHARPHTTSRQLYKGILDGAATGVFNGKVVVRPDAQKTSAEQTNRNLLLSRQAQINTKPQLEIFADDVRCSHGATIGQLDAAALFYLQSRGLAEDEARQLLTYAFASEVLRDIGPGALKDALAGQLLERLPHPAGLDLELAQPNDLGGRQ